MPKSPLQGGVLLDFSITVQGQALSDVFQVTSLRTYQQINSIGIAEITLAEGLGNTFQLPTSLQLGATIQISLGYDGVTTPVFRGEVTGLARAFDLERGYFLVVTCREITYKLTMSNEQSSFQNQRDSEIITRVVGEYGMAVKIAATPVQHPRVIQQHEDDWSFIVGRATRNGMVVYMDQEGLVVKPPELAVTPILSLQTGYDVLQGDLHLAIDSQYATVIAEGVEADSGKRIKVRAKNPVIALSGFPSDADLQAWGVFLRTLFIQDTTPTSLAALQGWANATLLFSRLAAKQGSISFQGSALARVNSLCTLQGLGHLYDGVLWIREVTHVLKEGGWQTTIQTGWPPT